MALNSFEGLIDDLILATAYDLSVAGKVVTPENLVIYLTRAIYPHADIPELAEHEVEIYSRAKELLG